MLTIQPLRDFLHFLPSLPVPAPAADASTQLCCSRAVPSPPPLPAVSHQGLTPPGPALCTWGSTAPLEPSLSTSSTQQSPLSHAWSCLTPSTTPCRSVSKRLQDTEGPVASLKGGHPVSIPKPDPCDCERLQERALTDGHPQCHVPQPLLPACRHIARTTLPVAALGTWTSKGFTGATVALLSPGSCITRVQLPPPLPLPNGTAQVSSTQLSPATAWDVLA